MKSRGLVVGFFTIAVIAIMISFMFWQSNITRRLTGYTLIGRFDQVAGLIKGSEVRYRGFRVGRVLDVHPNPEYIDATFWVSGDVDITKGSTVKIMFDGLVGENYLSVVPNLDSSEMLSNNDLVLGRSASDLAHFIDLGHENLLHTEIILKALADLVDDGQIINDIRSVLSNVNSISSFANDLFEGEEEYDMKQILTYIQSSTKSFDELLSNFSELEIDQMMAMLLTDINTVSSSMTDLSTELKKIINDENVANINSTIGNFDDFSAGLSSYFGKELDEKDSFVKTIFNTSIVNETAVFYDMENSSGYLDSDFLFNLNKFSFITGLSSRSGVAKFDQFQQAYHILPTLRARLGVYQNAEAVGVDYLGLFKSKLSLNLYDFENKLYELSLDYPLINKFDVAFDIYNDIQGNGYYDLGIKFKL